MNAITRPLTGQPGPDMPVRRIVAAYLAEIRSECLRYLRNPAFILPLALFPVVFYLMFGVLMNKSGEDTARYLLASYGSFGIMGPGLFGFGVSLAIERDGGLLTLKRALPMPAGAYLLGKMVMAMLIAILLMVLLLLLGIFAAEIPLSWGQIAALLATAALGVLPFCALGMLIGSLIKGQGALGLLNLVYLPMAFLSGLWWPLSMMPALLGKIAPLWPSYHLKQIALVAVAVSSVPVWPHALVLLGVTFVLLLFAVRRLRRHG